MRKSLILLILLGIFLSSSPAPAAPPIDLLPVTVAKTTAVSVETRIKFWTDFLLLKAPPYVWGGAWGPLGNDCSGAMYWIFRKSGVPVPRLSALAMWNGGWPGEHTRVKEGARELSQFPDLIFFDFTVDRPRGHVGLIRWNVIFKKQRNIMMAESSSSKNKFKETLILQDSYHWRATHGVLTPNLKMGAGGRK